MYADIEQVGKPYNSVGDMRWEIVIQLAAQCGLPLFPLDVYKILHIPVSKGEGVPQLYQLVNVDVEPRQHMLPSAVLAVHGRARVDNLLLHKPTFGQLVFDKALCVVVCLTKTVHTKLHHGHAALNPEPHAGIAIRYAAVCVL